MDAKKTKEIRRALFSSYDTLAMSIDRNRLAAEEIRVEKTEDEGDLATISHDRDVLYNLHEGNFVRMQSILAAVKALDRGQYGECTVCGEGINQNRLAAVPWATTCVHCQEEAETATASLRYVPDGDPGEASE